MIFNFLNQFYLETFSSQKETLSRGFLLNIQVVSPEGQIKEPLVYVYVRQSLYFLC